MEAGEFVEGSPEWAGIRQAIERDAAQYQMPGEPQAVADERTGAEPAAWAAPVEAAEEVAPLSPTELTEMMAEPVAMDGQVMSGDEARDNRRRDRELKQARRRARVAWAIAALACACVVGTLIAAYSATLPGGWERANGPVLLGLKAQAEALAMQGKLAEAHAAYRRIEELVVGRQIRDVGLREQLDGARAAQDRIFLALLDRNQGQKMAPPPQPVASAPPAGRETAAPVVTPPTTQAAPVATEVAVAPVPVIPAPLAAAEVLVKEPPRRPGVRGIGIQAAGVTDEEIGQAISRGADYLLSQFQDSQLSPGLGQRSGYYAGLNTLCVYALLQCGQTISDERLNVRAAHMKGLLQKMRDMPIEGYCQTYARGLRATALAVYNRAEDRAALKADVAWLIRAARQGAYTYADTNPPNGAEGVWDNSNSQYGLLGVWSAAEVGIEVPQSYWTEVQNHWHECQHDSGEWGYRHRAVNSGRLSMTVAGLASLFVTHDYLEAPQFGSKVGTRQVFSKPLAKGLAWLESGDNAMRITFAWPGYTLYGLERVGLASGLKYFGKHDWYRELAGEIVVRQGRDGSVGDLVETSYALLFLARGRHPILMNKLRFEGAWANRPRDLANLARFASRELERPLNWQVVPLDRDWTDWMDSPVLYLASHEAVPLKDEDYAKLRRFVEAGGLIFTQADGGSAAFNQYVVDLAGKTFPTYEWIDLPPDHEIYVLNFRVNPKPKLWCLTNGSRILMIHSPEDITQGWQLRAEKSKRHLFDLGVNVFLYAAGKADLRNRLSSPYLPPLRRDAAYRLRVARIKYSGLWDPEPYAFERFSRWFEHRTGYALDVTAVESSQLQAELHPVAHLTGTAPYTPTENEIASLRRYVESGGVLVIDACGGAWQFEQSVTTGFLPRAFPMGRLTTIPPSHPLFAGKADGMDLLPRPLLRPYAENKLPKGSARMQTLASGKGQVIYSPLDLTTGLLGTNTWAILGYRPSYAQSLMKNILLWVADGREEGKVQGG